MYDCVARAVTVAEYTNSSSRKRHVMQFALPAIPVKDTNRQLLVPAGISAGPGGSLSELAGSSMMPF